MKSRSSQGRQENGNHRRKTQAELTLSRHKGFTYVPDMFSILDASKNDRSHYLYTHLGYEIELRYSQVREEWTAVCPYFEIETQFPHEQPDILQLTLNIWLVKHIENVICPLPAVLEIAQRHDCTLEAAQVILDERASL